MIGRAIGNFVVVREIGAGGMGTVYVATHPRMGKRVAIKVLRPEHGSNQTLARRFVTEARAVARIRSEHVVDVLDFGERPDGTCYLVMELLDGRSLREVIDTDGVFPAARAVHVGIGVLRALALAHAVGVVHRDLKPDNLFLVRRGRDPDFVKVLDFGIARLRDDGEPAPDNLRTRTGAIIGTPAYMAPEQCRGAHRAIDARTDLYSLGVILYQLVTGRRPFAADHVGDLLLAQMTTEPEPPGAINPEVPAALEKVILRALRKTPEERFQSAAEMAYALADAVGISITIEVPPPIAEDQTQNSLPAPIEDALPETRAEEERADGAGSRRGGLILVGGTALVAAVLGLGIWFKAGRPAPVVPVVIDAAAPEAHRRLPGQVPDVDMAQSPPKVASDVVPPLPLPPASVEPNRPGAAPPAAARHKATAAETGSRKAKIDSTIQWNGK